MITKFYLLSIALLAFFWQAQAQVGINTETPQAMLEVNGDLIVKEVEKCEEEDCFDTILVVNNEGLVKHLAKDDLFSENVSFIVAKGNGDDMTISIDILDHWGKLILDNVVMDAHNDYNPITGVFTAPKDGIYQCYAQVKSASLLSAGFFGVGIFLKKASSDTPELLADETFVNLSVLTVPVTTPTRQVQIIVDMEEGDELFFGVTSSLISLDIITNSQSYFTINQIK